MCECQGNPLARVTLPPCKQGLSFPVTFIRIWRGKTKRNEKATAKKNQPQTKLLKEGNKLKRKETFVIINSSKEITSNSKNRDRKLYFSMATLYAVRGTQQ